MQTMSHGEYDQIGIATMNEDRTVVLRLRAVSEDNAVGEACFSYSPMDENYESIISHIGGINPGESKPVPPWPED